MKQITCIFMAALLSLAVFAAERPARQIQIGKKNTAVATAVDTEIVVAPDAPQTTLFAAKELQSFLSQIFGREVPVVKQISNGKVSFILGVNPWAKEAGIDAAKLVRDAFIIKTDGSRIYIAGLDDPKANPERALARGGVWSQLYERGTLFGVYDFLERVAGVRMYFPGELGTVVPKTDRLAIPEMSIYDRPDFTQRKVSTFWDGTYFEGEKRDAVIHPAKTLNNYRLRLETEYLPCCHGLNHFRYIQRFGKTHPEYFALQSNGKRSNDLSVRHPGQLCYTSGIVEEIYQDVRSYLKGEKADVRKIPSAGRNGGYAWGVNTSRGTYVDIMPQDAFSGCRCEKCQAAYRKNDPHYATELIWGNTVTIANRLKKEGIPGIITMMAYRPYRRVPAMDIPDNVMVMVAETGPWSKGNPAQKKLDDEEIRAWTKKLGRKVWIWNYVNKGATLTMPGVPQMSPRAYGEYYKGIAPWIFGAFAESESDRFLYNYLNYYIFSKVAWDNKADFEALLEEHYRLMFGNAAPAMKKFYGILEDKWVGQVAGRVVDTPLGPVGAPPSDYDLWNKVYSAKVLAGLDRDLKDAAGKVPADSLEAKRIALIRKEFYEPLVNAAKAYHSMSSAVQGLKFHIAGAPGKELYLLPFRSKKEGALCATVKTGVQVWRTENDLCIRFRCGEPRMSEIVAQKRKADDPEIWKDNSVEIFLNPSGDRKTYYQLMVNSEGSLSDQKIVKLGASGSNDLTWNSGASVEVKKEPSAWIAEIAIPLKNLPDIREEFPANFARSRILKTGSDYETLYHWSPFARGFHDLENYGSITSAKEQNILINSDFSMFPERTKRHFGIWEGYKWIGGWIGDKSNTAAVDSEICVSAPFGMRLQSEEGATVMQYLPALKPATKYRLSFFVKLQDVKPLKAGGGVCANLYDDANRWFPAHNWLTGTMDWTFQSYEFTTGKNTNAKVNSYLRLRLMNASGTVWFDDVKLEEL